MREVLSLSTLMGYYYLLLQTKKSQHREGNWVHQSHSLWHSWYLNPKSLALETKHSLTALYCLRYCKNIVLVVFCDLWTKAPNSLHMMEKLIQVVGASGKECNPTNFQARGGLQTGEAMSRVQREYYKTRTYDNKRRGTFSNGSTMKCPSSSLPAVIITFLVSMVKGKLNLAQMLLTLSSGARTPWGHYWDKGHGLS